MLEASAEDIDALSEDMGTLQTQLSSLSSEVSGLDSKATQLEAGLSSASNIGYASIALAVIIGAVAVFLSRRGM